MFPSYRIDSHVLNVKLRSWPGTGKDKQSRAAKPADLPPAQQSPPTPLQPSRAARPEPGPGRRGRPPSAAPSSAAHGVLPRGGRGGLTPYRPAGNNHDSENHNHKHNNGNDSNNDSRILLFILATLIMLISIMIIIIVIRHNSMSFPRNRKPLHCTRMQIGYARCMQEESGKSAVRPQQLLIVRGWSWPRPGGPNNFSTRGLFLRELLLRESRARSCVPGVRLGNELCFPLLVRRGPGQCHVLCRAPLPSSALPLGSLLLLAGGLRDCLPALIARLGLRRSPCPHFRPPACPPGSVRLSTRARA